MEVALAEFVDKSSHYLVASDKVAIQKWESYVHQLLDRSDNQGFFITVTILKQYQSNVHTDIYFLAAHTLRTICRKKSLPANSLQEILQLLNLYTARYRFRRSHTIVVQLSLACSALFMHEIYSQLSQRYATASFENMSSFIVQEIQNFFNHHLTIIQDELLRLDIIQRISEYFTVKDIKNWISMMDTNPPSSSVSLIKSGGGNQAKLKIELMNKIQVSLLNVTPIMIQNFIHLVSNEISFIISSGTENLQNKPSLNLVRIIFGVSSEWLININSLDIFEDAAVLSSQSASNNAKKQVPEVLLSLSVMAKLTNFWLQNPLINYSLAIILKSVNNRVVDGTFEEEGEEGDDDVGKSLDFLSNVFELVLQILQYGKMIKFTENMKLLDEEKNEIVQVSLLFNQLISQITSLINPYIQHVQNSLLATDISKVIEAIQPLLRMLSSSASNIHEIYKLFVFFLKSPLPVNDQPLHTILLGIQGLAATVRQLLGSFYFIYGTMVAHTLDSEIFQVFFEPIDYCMEIWLEMMKLAESINREDFSAEITNHLKSSLELLIQFSNFYPFSRMNGLPSESLIEQVNDYRQSLRDFLRDVSYSNLFQVLLFTTREALINYLSLANNGHLDQLQEHGYWLETFLHALSSICREKCNIKLLHSDEIVRIQPLLIELWKPLLHDVFVQHRLVSRMNVIILSEVMRFFLDSQDLLPAEALNEVKNLFLRSYQVIFMALQHHEVFQQSSTLPNLSFEQSVPFRVKQDHVGAVAFQKAMDYLMQNLLNPLEKKTKTFNLVQHHPHVRMETEIFHEIKTNADQLPVLLNGLVATIFRNCETLGPSSLQLLHIEEFTHNFNFTSTQGNPLVVEMLGFSIIYWLHHSSNMMTVLPIEWPSFSIFFHSVNHFATSPEQLQIPSRYHHQTLLLIPLLLATLTQRYSNSITEQVQTFSQLLINVTLVSPNQNDSQLLNYLTILLARKCTQQLLFSLISEIIQSSMNNFQNLSRNRDFPTSHGFLSVLENYSGYIVVILIRWISLIVMKDGTSTEIYNQYCANELLDEIFDRLCSLMELVLQSAFGWLSSNAGTAQTQSFLKSIGLQWLQECEQTLLPIYVYFISQYFPNEFYLKRSINSIFRLLMNLSKFINLTVGSGSEASLKVQAMIQSVFHQYSKLGIDAVHFDQQNHSQQQQKAEIRRKEMNTIQNVFYIGVERENKRTVQRTKYLQHVYLYNLYVLLKFWILSFDYLIPSSYLLPFTHDSQISSTFWDGMDKTMIISVVEVICNSIIISSTAALTTYFSGNGNLMSHVILSEEIWRLMIQLLHLTCGKILPPASSKSLVKNDLSPAQKIQNKQSDCYCVELIDNKIICVDSGSIPSLSSEKAVQWLNESGLKNRIIQTIFHSLLLSSTFFTSITSGYSNFLKTYSLQISVPASQREQAISILEHLYLLYGANDVTNLLLQYLATFINDYYAPFLQRKENLNNEVLTQRVSNYQEQVSISITQLFSSATIGDWKRFKNILKLLCR